MLVCSGLFVIYSKYCLLLEVLRLCLCKEYVSSSRRFSVRCLGCCKLFLLDVYLYVNAFHVTGITNVTVLKGFRDVC